MNKPRHYSGVRAAEEPGFQVDSGDLILGIILLLLIPTLTYIALGAAGMPVNGQPGMDFIEGLEAKDKRAALKGQDAVPMTVPEYNMRYQRTRRVLNERYDQYKKLVMETEGAQERGLWVDLGRVVVTGAKTEFENLLTSLKNTGVMGTEEQSNLRAQIAQCEERTAWLDEHDPFAAIREMDKKSGSN